MKIIAVAAAKGGVGKTTIAASLAVAASFDEYRPQTVAVMDLDPGGSLTEWWNRRGALETPAIVDRGRRSIGAIATSLRGAGCDLLVLDCPPNYSPVHRESIDAADLVVIPTGPGALDLEAVGPTVEMAERSGVPHYCVLNGANFRSRLAGEAVRTLRDRGVVLLPPVYNRVAIGEAAGVGLTAIETQPTGRAARKLTAVWQSIRVALDLSSTATRVPLLSRSLARVRGGAIL